MPERVSKNKYQFARPNTGAQGRHKMNSDNLKTTIRKDTIRYFDVYAQTWGRCGIHEITDKTLATLPEAERQRIYKAQRKDRELRAKYTTIAEAPNWARQAETFESAIAKVLELAEKLPSGQIDKRAPEKLIREYEELKQAVSAEDEIGAALEAGDMVYYAVKAIALAAQITELSIESIYGVALAKYALRALPGNVKDDAAERLAAKAVLGIEMHTQIREDGPAEER